jgi:hypothetical protein
MTVTLPEKVSIIPDRSQAVAIVTPMDMIQRAVDSGASMEVLEKMMALQERWEANQARKAFDAALAAAKSEIPVIVRNATAHNSKKYADFAAIASVVAPILGRHGLSYRFQTVQTEKITVTCLLFGHGHSEGNTLSGLPDTSGNKSGMHALGSTLTYLQRYSLVQALGLAAANDDDGKAATITDDVPPPPGSITLEQVDHIIVLLEDKGASRPAFLQWAGQKRLQDIPAEHFDSCIEAIKKFKKAGK